MRPLSTPLMCSSVTDAQVQRVKPLLSSEINALVHIIDSVNTKAHLSTWDIHRVMVHFLLFFVWLKIGSKMIFGI